MRGWRSGKPKAKPKPKKQKQELNLGIKRSRKQKIITPNNVDIPNSISIKTEIPEKKKKEEDGLNRFFGCYLLTSLSPRFKGHSYIGFTVNPKRRIRQHNGEITSGAVRTKKKRPWEMVLCIHGFPTNVAALQFEWAWQHPRESVAVREAALTFKTLGGLANKIKLALTMLTLHTWQSMNLTVSFFSTKYMKHVAGSPSLPHQMKLHSCSMDVLPCYMDNAYLHGCDDEDDFDSNDGEVSGNFSDDKVESSPDDSMDLNLSSIHAPSCTRQKISDDLLEGDPFGISGSMAGTLESIQSLHQLPVDVSGATQSILNELSQPCEEFWIEDVRASFPDLEEHMQPDSGVDVFENEMYPHLEEEHPSHHLFVDIPSSTGNDINEYLSFGKESEAEELRGSCPIIEDRLQPFQQAGPSDGQQSPLVDSVSSIEDVTKKDEIACIVIDDITQEQCQPTRAHSTSRFSNTIQPYSSQGIEVIELCTPSPDIRITRGSKKKRTNSGFPDIIDLTRSPSFVQL